MYIQRVFPGSDILKPITNVFTAAAADANGLQNSFPCLFFFLHHYKVTQQITKVTMSFKCELWGPFLHTTQTPPCPPPVGLTFSNTQELEVDLRFFALKLRGNLVD